MHARAIGFLMGDSLIETQRCICSAGGIEVSRHALLGKQNSGTRLEEGVHVRLRLKGREATAYFMRLQKFMWQPVKLRTFQRAVNECAIEPARISPPVICRSRWPQDSSRSVHNSYARCRSGT